MNVQRSLITLTAAMLAFTAGSFGRPAAAAEIIMPNVPLIVSIDAVPNIWFQMDDSGSMDWEIMAGPHFPDCRYNPVLQCTNASPPAQGRMRSWTGEWENYEKPDIGSFSYIFDLSSGDHTYGDSCTGNNNGNSTEDCYDDFGNSGTTRQSNPGPDNTESFTVSRDWRMRSSDLNVQFFNPNIDYIPWADSSDSFGNASFTSARSWPVPGEDGYSNQLNLNSADEGGPFYYHVWIDDKGWDSSDARPDAGDINMTVGANGVVDQWDSFIKVKVSTSGVSCERITHDPKDYDWPDEIRGINPTATPLASTDSDCVKAMGNKTAAELRQDVANWFQYYRRRTHVARGAVGNVVEGLPNYRYGVGHINSSSSSHYIPASDITDYEANNEDLLDELYGRDRTSNGTPLRRGLERVGRMYGGELSGVDSPITLTCQKNFTLLFSDGFWNGNDPYDVTSDQDGDGQTVDGEGVTLADVAAYYYDNDLRTDLDDAVPTDSFDSANYQHMVTYTIAFGLTGGLEDTDDDGWPNPPLTRTSDWYPLNNEYDKVDDMWHAAWNGRGQYFNAQKPEELYDNVREALTDIASRIGGAASAAANSGSISSTSRIFQAKFDSADWHGELLAYPVNDDGTLGGTAVWDANALLNAKSNSDMSSRDVFTWNPTANDGRTFVWANLNNAQQTYLNTHVDGTVDGLGQDRLDYIKGLDNKEVASGGPFRDRTNKLGDIVNSDPIYVGYPPFFYSFDNYYAYFAAQANRTGVIYVGAGDGMLHAFEEATGEEMFAYVPNAVYENLSALTDPDYEHRFFVDGPPGYGDAQISGSWKSIIAGGLRSGGQAVYALDVTAPNSFDATDVLWEFSDAQDADLGYVWGEPQIKRMQNGKWAVIVGSGLNNTEADGHASSTGYGYLFIIYLEGGGSGNWVEGTDYVKIPVPGGTTTTPNALFTPAAADIDGDAKVDYIYAGDRFGKLWKFDVTSATATGWGLDFSGSPFFDAGTTHPITDRPAIAAHPESRTLGQLVLFGTGKYIETTDNDSTGQPTQTMYGLWDFSKDYITDKAYSGEINGYDKTDLQQNSYSVQDGVRVIDGGTEVEWLDGSNEPSDKGWYLDLPDAGERMVRRPVLRDNLVFFVTMTPDDDPCAAGGTGYISVLDISTGIAPTFPVFDVDGDQDVTTGEDTVEPTGGDPDDDSDNLVPVGIKSPSIPNLPALIYDDRPGFNASNTQFPPTPNSLRGCDSGSARAYTFTTGSNGSILAIETATEALSCGRQNWRGER